MFDAKERAAAATILFGYTLMIELKLYSLIHPKINKKLSPKTLKRCYKTMHSRNKAQHKQRTTPNNYRLMRPHGNFTMHSEARKNSRDTQTNTGKDDRNLETIQDDHKPSKKL
jgi:hypothetical protein